MMHNDIRDKVGNKMSEAQQTIMEKLFHEIDSRTKALNKENGQSLIENLGLAMEHVYTQQREMLEQSTLQDRRKAFQFAYLSIMQVEEIQPNHQMTPDAIGMILGYLVQRFTQQDKDLNIVDLTSGTGNLSATLNEVLTERNVMHHLVEVDPVLSRLSIHLANFLEIPFDVYPQDAIMPLPFEDGDVVIGDFPVGYYPMDERSKEMALGFEEGHSYAHYLLIEQALEALKAGGFAFLVVPSNLFEGEHVKQLEKFITTASDMQAFLNLPRTLFKTEHANKSILILQKKQAEKSNKVEVLLADIPDFKHQQSFKTFLDELDVWMSENHPEI